MRGCFSYFNLSLILLPCIIHITNSFTCIDSQAILWNLFYLHKKALADKKLGCIREPLFTQNLSQNVKLLHVKTLLQQTQQYCTNTSTPLLFRVHVTLFVVVLVGGLTCAISFPNLCVSMTESSIDGAQASTVRTSTTYTRCAHDTIILGRNGLYPTNPENVFCCEKLFWVKSFWVKSFCMGGGGGRCLSQKVRPRMEPGEEARWCKLLIRYCVKFLICFFSFSFSFLITSSFE